MSSDHSIPRGGSTPPVTLAPLLKALKTRDHEGLSKLRHALRTPLNQIIGYSELLMETAAETGTSNLLPELKRIHSGGGELLALINDALAAWKIEAGKVDFAALREDLRTPLGSVITLTGQSLEQAHAATQPAIAKDLEKILLALSENTGAAAIAEAGSPAPGLEETSRAAAPLIAPPPGLGNVTPHDFHLSTAPMPSARILAVDDDAMNRDMLLRRLEKLGYDVTEAATGREALAKVKEGNFDLILLDILMPDLDGFQTLEYIKADPRLKHIPVIMLTALDDVDSTVRCIEAGAEDYVPKPFNPVILRARITASLEKSASATRSRPSSPSCRSSAPSPSVSSSTSCPRPLPNVSRPASVPLSTASSTPLCSSPTSSASPASRRSSRRSAPSSSSTRSFPASTASPNSSSSRRSRRSATPT